MGKASLPKTSINDTLDANRERKKQFGRERNAYSGATGVALNSGSGFNSTTNKIVQVQTLKTAGDTMMGPLAFYPRVEFLNTGVTTLDISKATNEAYSSRVIVSGQSNAATISTISGAAHAGQILFLQAASAQTITINETGNISIPGSTTSYVMTANEIILLQYDTTTTKWITVTLGGGAGSGANTTLSNLTSPTAINQDLNMGTTNSITFDTDKNTYIASTGLDDEVGIYTSNSIRIKVQNTKTIINNELSLLDGLTVGTTAPITFANNQEIQGTGGGIDYAVPSGDTHEFAVNSALKLTIAETLTTSSNDISMGGNDLEFGIGGTINFYSSASMASGGSATALPSNPTGYFAVKHQGNTRYIPFYS